jgi:hypothetical protein
MKKVSIFLLLAVMLLTACGQNKEAAYVNITSEEQCLNFNVKKQQ